VTLPVHPPILCHAKIHAYIFAHSNWSNLLCPLQPSHHSQNLSRLAPQGVKVRTCFTSMVKRFVQQLLTTFCLQMSQNKQSKPVPRRSTRLRAHIGHGAITEDKTPNLLLGINNKTIVGEQSTGDDSTTGTTFRLFRKLVRCLAPLPRRGTTSVTRKPSSSQTQISLAVFEFLD
jgi:hypothetical protein